ncbi:MAG: GTPase HflX [bacterium]|nr:GTPase HflX [bacterium]
MYEVPRADAPERGCLVGFTTPDNMLGSRNVSLEELRALAATARVEVVAELICPRAGTNPAYFIGTGKAHELAALCRHHDLHLVIFDHDLSPVQTRNLEELTAAKIIDRTGIILHIFAQRARTREGKLQVELAQLQYMLPRLTRMWTHLSRQYGGVGTRGPGEQQLEVDRRRVQTRIRNVRNQLALVRRQRAEQRKRRQHADIPIVALVGYTNAGKSTLLHALTRANVLIEDKLFATLDPTARVHRLPSGERFVFVDTVGFIRNLPHGLVEAFKATLEEVCHADILLHLADASAPDLAAQIAAVESVLHQLDAHDKPQLLVLNKIDLLSHRARKELQQLYPHAVCISAQYRYGFSDMFTQLRELAPGPRVHVHLRLPPHKSLVLSRLYAHGKVINVTYNDDCVLVDAMVPDALLDELHRYRVKEPVP